LETVWIGPSILRQTHHSPRTGSESYRSSWAMRPSNGRRTASPAPPSSTMPSAWTRAWASA